MEPAGDVESLRCNHQHVAAMKLPANQDILLENIRGNSLEIVAEIDPGTAPMVEMHVLRSPKGEERTRIMFYKGRGYVDKSRSEYVHYSAISVDTSYASTLPDVQSRAPETADVLLGNDEPLRLRVFLDRSAVEVFVNGRQCLGVRVYPGRKDSIGVALRSQGQDATLTSLDAWEMRSIYD
jgi:beta-fructofuranosidase